MMTPSDVLALLPEFFVLLGAVVALLAGSFLPREHQAITRYVSVAALALGTATATLAIATPASTVFTESFAIDVATGAVRLIVPLSTVFVIVLGKEEFSGSPRESETYSLLLLSSLGAMVMAGATDLLVLAGSFLLASIPLYALVGLSRKPGAAEAALKTYLLGAVLGIGLLLGISILFGIGGSTTYSTLRLALADAPSAAVAAGVVGILAGLMFKAGGVPGHFWVPDATQASGTAVAAYVTSVPKIGAIIAAYRLIEMLPSVGNWPLLIAVLATASMTLGNLAAFWQDDVRRLLGWSTVSQVGYLLLPVAVAGHAALALPSMLLYLAAYAVTNLTAFAVVAALPERRTIADFKGAAASRPWLSLALVVSLLGLVGTPPTSVFVGKFTIFTAAWDGGLAWLVVVALVNSLASLFYYMRWLAPMFARKPEQLLDSSQRPWAGRASIVGALASVAIGVFAGLVLTLFTGTIAR